MSVFQVNRNPSRRDLRVFGWVMLCGLAAIGALLWLAGWRGAEPPRALFSWTGEPVQVVVVCMWAVGLAVWLLSLVSMRATKAVYIGWMTVAVPLGVVMSAIGLTLLFVVVLPLFSLIRLRDPLRMKLRGDGSYWEDTARYEPTLERMMRPF